MGFRLLRGCFLFWKRESYPEFLREKSIFHAGFDAFDKQRHDVQRDNIDKAFRKWYNLIYRSLLTQSRYMRRPLVFGTIYYKRCIIICRKRRKNSFILLTNSLHSVIIYYVLSECFQHNKEIDQQINLRILRIYTPNISAVSPCRVRSQKQNFQRFSEAAI